MFSAQNGSKLVTRNAVVLALSALLCIAQARSSTAHVDTVVNASVLAKATISVPNLPTVNLDPGAATVSSNSTVTYSVNYAATFSLSGAFTPVGHAGWTVTPQWSDGTTANKTKGPAAAATDLAVRVSVPVNGTPYTDTYTNTTINLGTFTVTIATAP